MTRNYLGLAGVIRGKNVAHFIRAKSVDKLKEKMIKWVDKVCKEQNKKGRNVVSAKPCGRVVSESTQSFSGERALCRHTEPHATPKRRKNETDLF